MPTDSIKQRIVRSLSDNLKQLINSHQYPLSKEVCLHALREGLRSFGADVEISDPSQTMSITMGFVDGMSLESYSFSTVLGFDEIMGGGDKVPGSIAALNHTSYRLFDEARYGMPRNYNGARWNLLMHRLNQRNITKMEEIINEEVERRRDAILLNRFLQESQTYTSNLVWDIIGSYDLEVYERALHLHSGDNSKPCRSPLPHQLLRKDWSTFTEEEWPSPTCIERFFWGTYLHAITKIKGYDYETKESMLREYLIKHGGQELVMGDRMKWGEQAFA